MDHMIKKGRYRHFKGNEYEVLEVAIHSETLEPMVVYKALYGSQEFWVRPASMWSEMVEQDGKNVPRFTYVGNIQHSRLNNLWDSGSEADWVAALSSYDTLYRNTDLEQFMSNLDPFDVARMSVSEFYEFLHDKYFVWKYTAKNRLKTTRTHLEKYHDLDCMEELEEIHKAIFRTDLNQTEELLSAVSRIRGLSTAGASGLLSILFPSHYGTVDQFVVKSLLKIDNLPEHDQLTQMNPESLSIRNGVLLEQILRTKAKDLNDKFQSTMWTPRKIDMVLWSYDR